MTTPDTVAPNAPPRPAERLLEALGAEAEFRDGLLGDLAEEHAIRAAWDGARAADRWYRREALRVAPHLLRDAARRLGWRDLRRFARVALTSYLFANLVHITFAGAAIRGVELLNGRLHMVRGSPPLEFSWAHPIRGAATLALLLTFTALAPVLSGFIAASMEDDAPVYPALALGAAQLGLLLVQTAVGFYAVISPGWFPAPAVPAWVLACQCLLVVAGPAVGVALQLPARRPPAAE
jgi:hypothetical protein